MHKTLIYLALSFTGLMGIISIGAEPADKVEAGASKKVMEVETVSVNTLESNPAQLKVDATGTVNSGGWSQPALVPVKSDDDGVLVFHFVAIPPDGIATQALAPIKASITVDKPVNFKEVKVVSQTNTKTSK